MVASTKPILKILNIRFALHGKHKFHWTYNILMNELYDPINIATFPLEELRYDLRD